ALAGFAALALYTALPGGATTTRTPAEPRRLAVLPFRNLKPDAETDFLGFSLANEVITKLDIVNSVAVCPSSYIDKYRYKEVEPKKAADELNVDILMTARISNRRMT
ncbi:MAG TPA: hypothetical protein VFO63_17635, partial [Blastocatellia bacterium]|nr:hypothetical protein [Blastocatellia bacterium]